jgi:aspartate 1-decarboxylase
MLRVMLKSKIHRATVTHADHDHAGALMVDPELLDAADLLPGERVSVVDVTNGVRLEAYVTAGERGSGVVAAGGAAAHNVRQGDLVTVTAYGLMDDAEAACFQAKEVSVDTTNHVIGARPAAAEEDELPPAETADAARLDALLSAEQ